MLFVSNMDQISGSLPPVYNNNQMIKVVPDENGFNETNIHRIIHV